MYDVLRPAAFLLVLATTLTGCAHQPADPPAETAAPALDTPGPVTPSPEPPEPAEPPSGTPAPAPAGADEAATRQLLAGLVVRPRPRPEGDYRRDAFGSRWADLDGNGCNQRDDVLLRDAVPGTVRVQRQGRCDHDVLAGTWRDPYAGREHRLTDLKHPAQASAVQIDHVVPLAEAWVSGARAWPARRRLRFANWLPGLLAVDGRTNASKGAADPAAWRPRQAYQCAYARRWIATKHRWRLAVDPSEVRALREMLDRC